ncbi:tRNA (adenosine(37)-N6)-threonylcarbamoyltransferase complex dimerization subunit type 1 TsaB [Parafilimonas sp.]|uniref:tRNA (adenosine(37)-N6)-threonylcarbamoyltransferase complex dimerization subunit type 1 TsaB n=1 Tax=Parafilimonas sp. TaxID=1969739 RepID=UPI0039E456B4
MALILHINTAFDTASVMLSSGTDILYELQNASPKGHASFLEPAIKSVLEEAGMPLSDVDAVSVLNGPGSYTGLRVGLSSAKALCYALQKPLILLNTLDVMGLALKLQATVADENILYCPMIDARRQEVFTALYNSALTLVKPYSSEIAGENFLGEEIKKERSLVLGGNGSHKFEKITDYRKIIYVNPLIISKPLIILANNACINQVFSSVAYSEPFYLKPVYFKK